jgi:hypothetical protein
VRGFKALVVAAVAALCVAGSASSEAAQPRIMIIGDSVATGMLWHPSAIAVMQRGLDVDWEVAVCRTLIDPGCPFEGGRPPSVLDLVHSLGTVPPLVVVEVGYNDELSTFDEALDESMTALLAAGAKQVLWLTLHEARGPFPQLNELLRNATARWPQLELVDWNSAAQGHDADWFQNDFLHLKEPGGIAMAHLVHGAVMERLDPLRITTAPLRLRAGRGYSLRLRAAGGTPPYRWRVDSGRPPRGFHLLADGRVTARLAAARRVTFKLSVSDADGVVATLLATAG